MMPMVPMGFHTCRRAVRCAVVEQHLEVGLGSEEQSAPWCSRSARGDAGEGCKGTGVPRRVRGKGKAVRPHLDERVLGALAGEDVARHLSAHAAGEVGDVHHFLHLAAALARDFAHFHGDE
jgi:hypothetical protein